MVLRYWGARGVNAEEFAPLLNAGGTASRPRVLVDALVERGWLAFAFTGTIGQRDAIISAVSVP